MITKYPSDEELKQDFLCFNKSEEELQKEFIEFCKDKFRNVIIDDISVFDRSLSDIQKGGYSRENAINLAYGCWKSMKMYQQALDNIYLIAYKNSIRYIG